uniref:Protein-serine/threonine kinase n=1 Tax=Trypanosoma congolense (strain IL3000) TaxID=1068625 RepID=G0UKQ5_TRYCI|nr:conserved hypothetical protein [Trypanosoma congolense IL3000]
MRWPSVSATAKHSSSALSKFLSVPLCPMDLRGMASNDRRHIQTSVEQLAARTARSYHAFSSGILKRSLDRETAAQLVPLESICKSEFKRCVVLSEMVEPYLKQLDSRAETAKYNEGCVDSVNKSEEDNGGCLQTQFIDMLRDLRPQENLLDVAVNEKCISSPDVNHWISCFCRRRVSWRVIHEHLLHLAEPELYAPVIRSDPCVGPLLQHAGTVVIDLYSRMVQAAHGGSLTITVEERPNLFTCMPEGQLVTSSTAVSPTTQSGVGAQALPSETILSVEGHLAYVFRELIKNACVALMAKVTNMELKVHFATNATHIVVDIIDTAGGLDPNFAEHYWQFGWSTNTSLCQVICGFGLGLPVSKVYMDIWNGQIDIYTIRGSGTTVRVTFPKAPVEALLPEVNTSP